MMTVENSQLVQVIDFWKKSVEKGTLFWRRLGDSIDMKSKEVIDIVGPRRSGKSSLLRLLMRDSCLKNNFLYLNFEDPFFITHNEPQIIEECVSVFQEYFSRSLQYLFFDEIQEIRHWEKAVRKLRDGGDFKIFVTGSSSKFLNAEMSSLLTGRHQSYQIWPLSFQEFLLFRKIMVGGKRERIIQWRSLLKQFDEYLSIGGFPEAVLQNNQELLKNYFSDILQKDIMMRHSVREKEILERMAVYLISNSGKFFSIRSLKGTFELSFVSTAQYLDYLKESFLLFELAQFSYSLKKQQKALKKIYSIDSGLARAVSFKFSEDRGRILENIVFLEFKRRGEEIYYYKNKDTSEVDFVVKKKIKVVEVTQVAWSLNEKKTKDREVGSLLAALKELKMRQGRILTYSETDDLKIDGKRIIIEPVYQWLLEEK